MKAALRVLMIVMATTALFGVASRADGTPITYRVSGIVSGTIGGTTFTNALVTVSLNGDSSNVVTETFGGFCPPNVCFVNVGLGPATVNISGIGTAAITGCTSTPFCTGLSAIYSFSQPGFTDPFPSIPFILIGTLDFPPAVGDFTGLGVTANNSLLGYDLRSPIGPITGLGGVGYCEGCLLHTTLGDLVIASNNLLPNGGTFTATVPEPSSLLLVGIGLAGLASARRRQAPKR